MPGSSAGMTNQGTLRLHRCTGTRRRWRCRGGADLKAGRAAHASAGRQFDRSKIGWSATDLALVFPVHPVHIMSLQVTGDGRADGRKEVLFTKLFEQAEFFQLVLHWIFELGNA